MNGKLKLTHFFSLLRATNLLIILLTQLLAWYFIIRPIYQVHGAGLQLPLHDILILLLATMLIAAGGYLVNDIFDIDVDEYNKRRNIIGKSLDTRSAWIIYYSINIVAGILGFYLAIRAGSFQLGFIFIVTAIMLYLYSSRYQNKLLTGNLVVSLLSAMVVLIVWLFEFMYLRNDPEAFIKVLNGIPLVSLFIWSYAGFAFLVSLIREFIKDMQDIEGDTRFGSYTLPVALGMKRVRIIIILCTGFVMAILAVAQVFLYRYGFIYTFFYLAITVQLMLIYLIVNVIRAKAPGDYAAPSLVAKFIMVAGILSMQIIYLDLK